ncbi:DUF2812 domain-containing protein [Clostridium tarantellae]|nr:DUF2812 domain-containing protein [Clostridium tarantellae]
MIKNIIKPFWNLNILKTEKWLEKMNTKNYELKKVNFKLGKFTFEKNNCNPLTYRIYHNSIKISQCSPSLKKEGWINYLRVKKSVNSNI